MHPGAHPAAHPAPEPEAPPAVQPVVASLNVSLIRKVQFHGEEVITGIFKEPVRGRLSIDERRFEGDEHADLDNHGGPDRAAYAYAEEDYRWWEEKIERALPPGKFGENLTLRGVDVTHALIGERWRIGNAVLQVASPCLPSFKLGMTMGDAGFVPKFAAGLRPGAYLSVVRQGDIGAGDEVQIISKPSHGLTIREVSRIYLFDRAKIEKLLVPELPAIWRKWVHVKLGK